MSGKIPDKRLQRVNLYSDDLIRVTCRIRSLIFPPAYNQRYNMPKLIISAGGDEFFLPDDSHYYYKQLQSPKYLKYGSL